MILVTAVWVEVVFCYTYICDFPRFICVSCHRASILLFILFFLLYNYMYIISLSKIQNSRISKYCTLEIKELGETLESQIKTTNTWNADPMFTFRVHVRMHRKCLFTSRGRGESEVQFFLVLEEARRSWAPLCISLLFLYIFFVFHFKPSSLNLVWDNTTCWFGLFSGLKVRVCDTV